MTRGEAGYTLIELLVAMLLLSFVGLAIAGGLQFGTRVWERTEQGIADTQSIEAAHDILRDALASALPHRAGGFARFDGEPDRIAFDGPAPRALGTGGVAHFELTVAPDSDGNRLVLKVKRFGDDGDGRAAVLAGHVGALHITYLDASGRAPTWLEFWRDRDRLPDAIEIASEDAGWPPLIVHPAVMQDASCQFDSVSISCRPT